MKKNIEDEEVLEVINEKYMELFPAEKKVVEAILKKPQNVVNYNVADLDRSLAFYEKALGLTEKRRINGEGFIIAYVGNAESDFELELTFVKDHPQNYDLGECEFHLAFRTADFEAAHKLHEEMGCICFENPEMGIYFITDPDGYWLEIVPER